ncbi:MAG: HugZ family protein, partial [Cyanobacteria bacterium J06635_10]
LADFRIFKLTPYNGRFVIGFGAAYHISGDNLDKLIHVTK